MTDIKLTWGKLMLRGTPPTNEILLITLAGSKVMSFIRVWNTRSVSVVRHDIDPNTFDIEAFCTRCVDKIVVMASNVNLKVNDITPLTSVARTLTIINVDTCPEAELLAQYVSVRVQIKRGPL